LQPPHTSPIRERLVTSAEWAKSLPLCEPLDGTGSLGSGSVGDMRQLLELPRISALRLGFPTAAGDAPLAGSLAQQAFGPSQ
jgi:hypothetical protein